MPTTSEHLQSRAENGDWASDWHRLTGVPFSPDSWRDLVHPDDLPEVNAEIGRMRVVGKFSAEYRVRCATGCYGRVRGYARRVTGVNGSEKWWGYVRALAGDGEHVCLARACFCALSGSLGAFVITLAATLPLSVEILEELAMLVR